ncbi:MAG: hypothetical protein LCH91_21280 [Bacteroidetes bacterium]|nr:hypothetical protein [Bacteroidota bacterium]
MNSFQQLKKLLWLDAWAATTACLGVVLFKNFAQPYLLLPLNLLTAMALIALLFACYSFHLVIQKAHSQQWVALLVVGNSMYALFCFGLAVYFWEKATALGVIYLLFDAAIVGSLAYIEWKAWIRWFHR